MEVAYKAPVEPVPVGDINQKSQNRWGSKCVGGGVKFVVEATHGLAALDGLSGNRYTSVVMFRFGC